jgi:hypothetical protein
MSRDNPVPSAIHLWLAVRAGLANRAADAAPPSRIAGFAHEARRVESRL